MAVIKTDTFTTGSNLAITTYDPDVEYIAASSGLDALTTGYAEVGVTGETCVRQKTSISGMPNGDQQQTLKIRNSSISAWSRNLLRCGAPGSFDCYLLQLDGMTANEIELYRVDGGSYTLLGSWDQGIANDSNMYETVFKATGTGATVNLSIIVAGGTERTYADSSGSRKTSGTPGYGGYNIGSRVDDLEIDDLASSGTTGTIAVTEASDTSAISGTSTINGSLSETETSDTSSVSGNSTITGSLAEVEGNDTAAIAGTSTVSGSLAETEVGDTAAFSGVAGGVTGSVAITEDSDTGAFSGTPTVIGSIAEVEANDTSAISGNSGCIGTLTPTDGADTSAIASNVTIPGSLAEVEADDTSAISGSVGDAVTGTLAGTEVNDTSGISGTSSVIGTLAEVEASDSASFSGLGFIIGILAVNDAVDVLTASGTLSVSGGLNTSDGADSGSLTGYGVVVGSLAETEENDTMSTRVGTPFTRVTYSISQPKVKSSGLTGNIWQIKQTSR